MIVKDVMAGLAKCDPNLELDAVVSTGNLFVGLGQVKEIKQEDKTNYHTRLPRIYIEINYGD